MRLRCRPIVFETSSSDLFSCEEYACASMLSGTMPIAIVGLIVSIYANAGVRLRTYYKFLLEFTFPPGWHRLYRFNYRERTILDYQTIKHFHMGCAALSGIFFVVRGGWMLVDSHLLQHRITKIAPHVIDTLLLISAVVLVFMSGQYPFAESWLTAKLIALVVYIGLGIVALKRGKTKGIRIAALIAALLTFAYIGAVAVTKQAFLFV